MMAYDLLFSLPHHVGKQVQSVEVRGDLEWHNNKHPHVADRLDYLIITFSDGTGFSVGYWASGIGGLDINETIPAVKEQDQ
jgi:hypothetical protein